MVGRKPRVDSFMTDKLKAYFSDVRDWLLENYSIAEVKKLRLLKSDDESVHILERKFPQNAASYKEKKYKFNDDFFNFVKMKTFNRENLKCPTNCSHQDSCVEKFFLWGNEDKHLWKLIIESRFKSKPEQVEEAMDVDLSQSEVASDGLCPPPKSENCVGCNLMEDNSHLCHVCCEDEEKMRTILTYLKLVFKKAIQTENVTEFFHFLIDDDLKENNSQKILTENSQVEITEIDDITSATFDEMINKEHEKNEGMKACDMNENFDMNASGSKVENSQFEMMDMGNIEPNNSIINDNVGGSFETKQDEHDESAEEIKLRHSFNILEPLNGESKIASYYGIDFVGLTFCINNMYLKQGVAVHRDVVYRIKEKSPFYTLTVNFISSEGDTYPMNIALTDNSRNVKHMLNTFMIALENVGVLDSLGNKKIRYVADHAKELQFDGDRFELVNCPWHSVGIIIARTSPSIKNFHKYKIKHEENGKQILICAKDIFDALTQKKIFENSYVNNLAKRFFGLFEPVLSAEKGNFAFISNCDMMYYPDLLNVLTSSTSENAQYKPLLKLINLYGNIYGACLTLDKRLSESAVGHLKQFSEELKKYTFPRLPNEGIDPLTTFISTLEASIVLYEETKVNFIPSCAMSTDSQYGFQAIIEASHLRAIPQAQRVMDDFNAFIDSCAHTKMRSGHYIFLPIPEIFLHQEGVLYNYSNLAHSPLPEVTDGQIEFAAVLRAHDEYLTHFDGSAIAQALALIKHVAENGTSRFHFGKDASELLGYVIKKYYIN